MSYVMGWAGIIARKSLAVFAWGVCSIGMVVCGDWDENDEAHR